MCAVVTGRPQPSTPSTHAHMHARIMQGIPRTGTCRLSCPGIATVGLFAHQEESENPAKEQLCLSASQAVTSRCRQQTCRGHEGPILFTLPPYCSVVQSNLFQEFSQWKEWKRKSFKPTGQEFCRSSWGLFGKMNRIWFPRPPAKQGLYFRLLLIHCVAVGQALALSKLRFFFTNVGHWARWSLRLLAVLRSTV